MKKASVIFLSALCLISCARSRQTMDQTVPRPGFQKHFLDVVNDTASTWNSVLEASNAFADSLAIMAADESNVSNRLTAQQWGHMSTGILQAVYSDFKKRGRDADREDIEPVLDRINEATYLWLYSSDRKTGRIWRDHFYASRQNSEKPERGFFHIEVVTSARDGSGPFADIYFPDAAEESPILIFSRYTDDKGLREDFRNQRMYPLEDWDPKGALGDGSPLHAKVGADMLERMLDYDVMYLMFRSGMSPDGQPGELEMTRLPLDTFQSTWKDKTGASFK